MFWKRKKQDVIFYDKSGKYPVIRSSICTGEQTAGFKDISTGKFEELMLIQDESDYRKFLQMYEVDESEVKREW